jgi:hypothetical protein
MRPNPPYGSTPPKIAARIVMSKYDRAMSAPAELNRAIMTMVAGQHSMLDSG